MRQPERSCPFCGDIDQIKACCISAHCGYIQIAPTIWVCGCFNKNCKARPAGWGKTRDEAIDNWERRAE